MIKLDIGTPAPDFRLQGDDNTLHQLADFKGKTLVLYFYPKDETPGCTTEACDFRDSWSMFHELDATIVGVSPDSIESHQKFKKNHQLPFLLLSDPTNEVAKKYGAFGEKSMYGKTYEGIIRSTFIIDKTGKLQGVFSKVSVSGHVKKIIESIESVK